MEHFLTTDSHRSLTIFMITFRPSMKDEAPEARKMYACGGVGLVL